MRDDRTVHVGVNATQVLNLCRELAQKVDRNRARCSKCVNGSSGQVYRGPAETRIRYRRSSIRGHPDVIAHTYREVCADSQTGPDPEVLAQLEELRQSRQQTHLAARSLLDLKDPDGPLVKSELKRLNDQMKSLGDSIRNLEAAITSASPVDLAEITQALSRLDPIWEVLYPEEQSRILELLIESVTVSENNVDIRFRTNGIEKIVEELTSQN